MFRLNLASSPASETMPTVPDKSTISSNKSSNPTRRKWTWNLTREVLHCHYCAWLSCKLSGFRKLMQRLWCEQNPSLAAQKRYLLTSGKLNESELEEIKREAEQDETPISGLSSVTTDVFVLVCRCRHFLTRQLTFSEHAFTCQFCIT